MFRHYIDASGASDVRATYERGSKQLKAKFVSRLGILANLPENEWREPYYKVLSRPCDGLGEIRFQADKVQQRPLKFAPANVSSRSFSGLRRRIRGLC